MPSERAGSAPAIVRLATGEFFNTLPEDGVGASAVKMDELGQGPRKILLVEDDADIRETLLELFEQKGYRAQAACDGLEALQLLRGPGRKPSVILLDLRMPRMDGYEFRARQLADPELSRIPVVVCTAEQGVEERARAIGAAGSMRKPIHVGELFALLEKLC